MLALRASSKPQELEMLAKRPQKRLHEAPKRCQMALRRPQNRPRGVQDASGGPFEPLQSPRSRKNDPRTSVFRASSKPQGSKTSRKAVSQASSSNRRGHGRGGFEALRHHREKDARRSGRRPSRWPRRGSAGGDFARSRSATDEGSRRSTPSKARSIVLSSGRIRVAAEVR